MSKRSMNDDERHSSLLPPNKRMAMEATEAIINTDTTTTIRDVVDAPVIVPSEMDVEVLRFRFLALKNHVEAQRNTIQQQDITISSLTEAARRHEVSLGVMNRYWNLLEKDIKALAVTLPSGSKSEVKDEDEGQCTKLTEGGASFLQQLIGSTVVLEEGNVSSVNSKESNVDDDDIQRTLISVEKSMKSRVYFTVDTLRCLIECIHATRENHSSDDSGECERLRSELAISQAKRRADAEIYGSIRDRLTATLGEYHRQRIELETRGLALDKSIRHVTKLKQLLTLERLKPGKSNGDGSDGNQLIADGDDGKGMVNGSFATTPANSTDRGEEFENELEEYRMLSERRLIEIDELRQIHESTLRELSSLRVASTTLSDARVMESAPFQSVQLRCAVATKEAQEAVSARDKAIRDSSIAVQQRNTELNAYKEAEVARTSEMQNELKRRSADLASSRAEVLRLVALNESKEAAGNGNGNGGVSGNDGGVLSQETLRLLQSLKERNTQLKLEAARYKARASRDGAGTVSQSDEIKQLHEDLRVSREKEKETRMLLSVIKASAKEKHELHDVLEREAILKTEVEMMRQRIAGLPADAAEASSLVESFREELKAKEADEEVLMSEVDELARQFEDIQEQNVGLVQRLKEKEDHNFQLSAEQVKARQLQAKLAEERAALLERGNALKAKSDAQMEVSRRIDDKERTLRELSASIERDLSAKQRIIDVLKKKASDAILTCKEAQIRSDSTNSQLVQLKAAVEEQFVSSSRNANARKRAEDEVAVLKKKIERLKKMSSNPDEYLETKVKQYKQLMTCPCCNVHQRNCVMVKCSHTFCMNCIQTRYETRQRKCPTCSDPFGQKDFQQFFL